MKILACIIGLLPCLVFGADSVYCVPAKPTTADSITFHLYSENYCCCAVYRGNTVSPFDSLIYLDFSIDNSSCATCKCAGGSWTEFKSGPLKAGTYAIYKAPSIYCPPGTPCPKIAIMPVRVGSVTISQAANVINGNPPLPFSRLSIRTKGRASFQLDYSLPSRSWINVSAYNAHGRIIATPFDNNAAPGNHRFNWDMTCSNGTYLVCISRNGARMASWKVVVVK